MRTSLWKKVGGAQHYHRSRSVQLLEVEEAPWLMEVEENPPLSKLKKHCHRRSLLLSRFAGRQCRFVVVDHGSYHRIFIVDPLRLLQEFACSIELFFAISSILFLLFCFVQA